jgi:hypothetical protein
MSYGNQENQYKYIKEEEKYRDSEIQRNEEESLEEE